MQCNPLAESPCSCLHSQGSPGCWSVSGSGTDLCRHCCTKSHACLHGRLSKWAVPPCQPFKPGCNSASLVAGCRLQSSRLVGIEAFVLSGLCWVECPQRDFGCSRPTASYRAPLGSHSAPHPVPDKQERETSSSLPCAPAEVTLTGSPLTHEFWLRRDRGTYGAAISAQNGSFPGSGTPVKGLYRCNASLGDCVRARALVSASQKGCSQYMGLHMY